MREGDAMGLLGFVVEAIVKEVHKLHSGKMNNYLAVFVLLADIYCMFI